MQRIINYIFVILSSLPSLAYAHGEDVLLTIYGDILLVIIFLIFLFFFKASLKSKLWLIVIFFGAYIAAWILTVDIPFRENKILINAIHWGLLFIVGLSGYLIIKRKL